MKVCYEHIDVLVIAEAKLDNSFTTSQILAKGFAGSFRLDRNRNGGEVVIYIRDDIPSRLLLKRVFPSDIEDLYTELSFRKCKWLLLGTYHPPSQAASPGASLMGAQNDNVVLFKNTVSLLKNEFLVKCFLID